ncbi:hypothetical protein ACA544_18175 [Vibrio cholerae]|uniref:hypothetical protein n=1 Tax=Vibrio cholerae TaxID=666 RepID=UPI000E648EE2|nr:hypothetical protein [Vibrio cholerae]MVC37395.1 hypothetical protein [Vibrio cholerae]TXY78023.1 hypothetical protein FXE80_01305 [Vibrio cholerae]GIB16909.1 hypothetical protein VCSRO90_2847 [Vibrio cholerae]
MKVLEIPATIRIFLNDSVTQEQIDQIAKDCSYGDFAFIEAGDSPEFEKKIRDYVSTDSDNGQVIAEVDLWASLDKPHSLSEIIVDMN